MVEIPDADEGRSTLPTARERLGMARLPIAAAALVAVVAVTGFGVPWPAGLAGFLALAAAVLAADGRPAPLAGRSSAPAGASPWPDTGMKLVLDALDDPCFLVDPAGTLRFQNEAATRRFGPPRTGDPLSFRIRVPELIAAVEGAGRGEPVEPVRFSERVPTERQYLAVCRPIRLARPGGRRERIAFVLVRLADESEQIRLERMRGDFIANASHELRTPLASLSGFIETLLGPARDDAPNRERFLRIMQEQASRMARLIDDLLSLSRIETKPHVAADARVDLAEVVDDALAGLAPLAADQDVRVERGGEAGPALVRGEADELVQVVTNLVENGIKYGRAGGAVRVSLVREGGPAGAAGFALSVADDGPGIPAEHLPRLTERFYRVDAANSRRQRGTGLGLAIVKHIVARHRGRLTIRSELDRGSTFIVWLPVAGGERDAP